MQIGNQTVVTVTYALHSSKAEQERNFVEETPEENPLVFLFGSGQLIPSFEENLNGLKVGETFSFSIEAENGYGEIEDEAFVKVADDMFKTDGILDLEILRIGNMVPLLDKEGNQLMARIAGIEDSTVLLDFNHPLAGHDLHFTGTVVSVREATPEELDHGHAHTPGMHEH
jgi:FKBP-type peptidyl-prolyl cis-trans isomerase SlyD